MLDNGEKATILPDNDEKSSKLCCIMEKKRNKSCSTMDQKQIHTMKTEHKKHYDVDWPVASQPFHHHHTVQTQQQMVNTKLKSSHTRTPVLGLSPTITAGWLIRRAVSSDIENLTFISSSQNSRTWPVLMGIPQMGTNRIYSGPTVRTILRGGRR